MSQTNGTEKAVVILHPVTCEPETVFITADEDMRIMRFTGSVYTIRLHRNRVNAMIRDANKWMARRTGK